MNWTTTATATQVREHGMLRGEVVLVPGSGWCVRDAAGNWFTENLVQTREEATAILYRELAPVLPPSPGAGS